MDKIVINTDETENNIDEQVDVNDVTIEAVHDDDKSDIVVIDGKDYLKDDNGNAIDESGKVIKTKDELAKPKDVDNTKSNDTLEVIQIGDLEYNVDKDGNAIDKDGKLAYTKDQLSEMEEDSDEDDGTIDVSKLASELSISTFDESGNPIAYENTEDGLKQYVEDVYQTAANDAILNLFNAYPVLNNLYYHLNAGKNLEDFNNVVDYGSIKLDKDNEDQLKNIIYTARTKRGDSKDQVDKYYRLLKASDTDNDEIYAEAQLELKYLNNISSEEVKYNKQRIKDAEAEQLRETENYWGIEVNNGNIVDLGIKDSVYSIIKDGVIKVNNDTFKIPDKFKVIENGKPKLYTKDDLFKYVYEPIVVNVNGSRVTTTRHKLDLDKELSSRSVHNDIFDAYRRLVKYDDSQLIKERVSDAQVKIIKKLKPKRVTVDTNAANNNKKGKVIIPNR